MLNFPDIFLFSCRMSDLYNFQYVSELNFALENETQSMTHQRSFVGYLTILSGIIGLTSYFLMLIGINFNFEFFSDTSLIFTTTGVSPDVIKWSMITDIFGYYLLLLPLMFFVHVWLTGRSVWSNLITSCGAVYIFSGAFGASILAAVWPTLLGKYTVASPEQQQLIQHSFENFSLLVVNGIWNLLNALLFGVWSIAFGLLIRKVHVISAWFTMIVGISATLDFLGNALGLKTMAETALNIYLILTPVWAIFIGIALLRNRSFLHNEKMVEYESL